MLWQGEKMFAEGDKVQHSEYGVGVFLGYDSLDSECANVEFDKQTQWGAKRVCVPHRELSKLEIL